MRSQRYVSDELTHFVGRTLREEVGDDEEREERRYELLSKVLRTGELLAIGPWLGDPEKRPKVSRSVSWDPTQDLTGMFTASVVCFCDIPVDDVRIHMDKYSEFGLAFSREFLLQNGANPVLYLANDAVIDDTGQANEDLFNEEVRHAVEFLQALVFTEQEGTEVPKRLSDEAMRLHTFLMVHLFPLIKPFRGDLEDEHPNNFYMEREWRLHGDLDFELDDVRRVYVPERFARRLREDLPEYFGQVTFAIP